MKPLRSSGEESLYPLQAMLKRKTLAKAIGKNRSILSAIVVKDENTARSLTRADLYLDEEQVDIYAQVLNKRIGSIQNHKALRLYRGLAQRTTARLASLYAPKLGVDAALLADAWSFSVMTELFTIIPIRHIARHIAKIAKGYPVVIPLKGMNAHYLAYWYKCEMEPFYVALELKRLGVPVVFALTHADCRFDTASRQSFTLKFFPFAPTWTPPHSSTDEDTEPATTALIFAGLRGIEYIINHIKHFVAIRSIFTAGDYTFEKRIFDNNSIPQTVFLPFIERKSDSFLPDNIRIYDYSLQCDNFGDRLFSLLGRTTKNTTANARQLIATYNIKNIGICSANFFETAIAAHVVKSFGGEVTLWPHSSNFEEVYTRQSNFVDKVYCITNSGAQLARSRYPAAHCRVCSQLMFSPCLGPRPFLPDQPLTVIIFATAHRLNRLPLFDLQKHRDSYRRLFVALSASHPQIRYRCKAKTTWEPMAWLQALADEAGLVLEEETNAPLAIEDSNLIFLGVSYASTALIEGISRGIPCMVVRETGVEDYCDLNSSAIQIGSVDEIVRTLHRCQEQEFFKALIAKQIDWYHKEIEFNDFMRP